MRLVIAVEPSVVELNYTWLPTWLGLNTPIKTELEDAISKHLIGKVLNDETLDTAHDLVVQFFKERFPNIEGLGDYLDALKFVKMK